MEEYYATVSASSFALVVFGAALIGSRLVSLAERAAMLDRERGDFMNRKISTSSPLQAGWAERGRRNELADLHVLVRRVREVVAIPVLVALINGMASLSPFLGWPDDSSWYRRVVLGGLLVASGLWIRTTLSLASDVLVFTRPAHEERERERREATKAGESYLISGDPKALAVALERLEGLVGVPTWRHPLRRLSRWRYRRRLARNHVGV